MLQLLSNLDAVKEAILFKMKIGFKGDYYSVLMLGEQQPMDGRGIQPGNLKPSLNWHVTAEEHAAYASNFKRFLADFEAEIADTNALEPYQWEYRTAAHHSGTAFNHLTGSDTMELPFFEISQLPNTFACDASVLHSGGIANSGLTLVALANRLADLMIHSFAGSDESTGMQASAPDR
jgi:choline dehydrogenase-like flavoprotein